MYKRQLRARSGDVVPLFERALRSVAERYDAPTHRLADDARALLEAYPWPGNVRELRNVAEQATVLVRQTPLTAEALRPLLRGVPSPQGSSGALLPMPSPARHDVQPSGGAGPFGTATDAVREREMIYRALLELRHEVRDLREQIAALLTCLLYTSPSPRD